MSDATTPSDFELWTYMQPGDIFEMSEESQRVMYDNHMKQKDKIKGLELDLILSTVEIRHGQFTLKSCESALTDRDKRIKELEEYNLGLANESCKKSERIAELEISEKKAFWSCSAWSEEVTNRKWEDFKAIQKSGDKS